MTSSIRLPLCLLAASLLFQSASAQQVSARQQAASQSAQTSRLLQPLVDNAQDAQLSLKTRMRDAAAEAIAKGSQSDVPDIEREALAIIYVALNGDGWVDNDNWLSNAPVSEWEGVTVVDDHVRSLILDSNGLTGVIPAAIGQLREVRTLLLGTCLVFCRENFVENDIGGSLPEQLNLLTNLEFLDVSGNNIGGTLPYLGDLANLEELYLGYFFGGNNVRGPLPTWLDRLTSLESISLAFNKFEGSIPPLEHLTALTDLDLSGNQLSGSIPDLRALVNLETLSLGNFLGGNQLSGPFPFWLGQMTSLETVFLSNQVREDGSGGLTGELPDMSGLVNARVLSFSGNRLTGTFAPSFASLPSIKQIDLGLTVDGDGETSTLRLGNQLEGNIPDLTGLANLENLLLSNNNFGPDPGPIGGIASLELLLMDNNDFEDLPDLTGLQNLQTVDARGNRMTFEDIRPNANIAGGGVGFLYVTQQPVPLMSEANGFVTLTMEVGGDEETTTYTWYRDDVELTLADEGSITIPNDPEDDSIYRAEATDSDITGLTLESEPTPLFRKFVVNSQGDDSKDDSAPTGTCDTGAKLPGTEVPECTLSAALEAANELGGGADISFDRSLLIVVPQNKPLPTIMRRVHIDDSFGTTLLLGEDHSTPGIRIGASNVVLRKLEFERFDAAIHILPEGQAEIDGNEFTDSDWAVVLESSSNHVHGNTIHVIETGISIRENGQLVSDNRISNNRISDEPSGAEDREYAVCISIRGGVRTTIRDNKLGCKTGALNMLDASDTDIANNVIGLDLQQQNPLGDTQGILISRDTRTQVRYNTLAGLNGLVLRSIDSGDLVVSNNKFGTDPSGLHSIPNQTDAISMVGGRGTLSVRNNTVSSSLDGIVYSVEPSVQYGTPRLDIVGNRIGTNGSGKCPGATKSSECPFRNTGDGIQISANSEPVRIFDNDIGWNGKSGVNVRRADGPITIEAGDLFNNGLDGIRIGQNQTDIIAGSVFVFDNEILLNEGHGVNATGTAFLLLRKNTIGYPDHGNFDHGVAVQHGELVQAFGNNIANNNGDGFNLSFVEMADIRGNAIKFNEGAGIYDESDPEDSEALIAANDVFGNKGLGTGIHLVVGSTEIIGNIVANDAGDGVALDVAGTASVTANNISSNSGFGLNNLNGSSTVAAAGNWWGATDGPSGQGSGSGDDVSSGVDFAGWLTSGAGLVIGAPAGEVPVPAGAPDTLTLVVQNWNARADLVSMSVSDTEGWYDGPSDFAVGLGDSLGAGFAVPLNVPASGAAQSTLTVTATSLANPTETTQAVLTLSAAARAVNRIAVGPDSALVAVGDTIGFGAVAYDQFHDAIEGDIRWSATGGTIDENGVFIAGSSEGAFAVTATDNPTGVFASVSGTISNSVATEGPTELPSRVELAANYPNPVSTTTTFVYTLPRESEVVIEVFDLLGRRVSRLTEGRRAAGTHSTQFEVGGLSSGTYFYRLRANGEMRVRKMVVVR